MIYTALYDNLELVLNTHLKSKLTLRQRMHKPIGVVRGRALRFYFSILGKYS